MGTEVNGHAAKTQYASKQTAYACFDISSVYKVHIAMIASWPQGQKEMPIMCSIWLTCRRLGHTRVSRQRQVMNAHNTAT